MEAGMTTSDLFASVEPAAKVTASDVRACLRRKYADPAYAYFDEVPDGTGAAKSRTLDALAMSLWPSRGLELIGMEIKVSRSDWLREIREPSKAEWFVNFCDRFFLVAGDSGIVKPGELPPPWGLMVLHRGRLRVEIEAPRLDALPVDRAFLAAILRRAAAWKTNNEAIREAVNEAQKRWVERGRNDVEYLTREVESLQRTIAEFEAQSGVSIRSWNAGNVGAAVNRVLNGGADQHLGALRRLRSQVAQITSAIDRAMGEAPE